MPLDINNEIDPDEFFRELGLQGIPFHKALGELIDNGISASITNPDHLSVDGPDEDFFIRLAFNQSGDTVELIIVDDGKGMSEDVVEEHLFRPGHKDSSGDGILNEHGMGLKHSLSALGGTEGDGFTLYTKTEAMDNDEIIKVTGPLNNLDGEEGDFRAEWEQEAGRVRNNDSGTRIHLSVPFETVNDAYARGGTLSSVMKGMHEHLGVMYHRYLEHTTRNQIEISWNDGSGQSGEFEVSPIYPRLRNGTDDDGRPWEETDTLTISAQSGQDIDIEFHRGIIDWDATREKYEQGRYDFEPHSSDNETPFRIYHRNNQATQGVNIVYRGRVLDTGLLTEIWEDQVRHNRYNRFTGELRIDDEAFQTLFNKTSINTDSPLWRSLKQKLNQDAGDIDGDTDYLPRRWGEEQQEKSLQKQLKEVVKNDRNCTDVSMEKDAGCDLDVDLLQEFEEQNDEIPVIIYEVKRGKANPIDVYQCVMYWDSYTHHKDKSLDEVLLVSDGITNNAEEVLELLGHQTDSDGDDYEIQQKEISDYHGIQL